MKRMSNSEIESILRDASDRGQRLKAALILEAGGLLSINEVADLLKMTKGEVLRRPFLALRLENGSFAWPAFQFESLAMMDAIEEVRSVMHCDEPWSQLHFLFLRLKELSGKTAVQAIREGSLESVVLAASHFGYHGAS